MDEKHDCSIHSNKLCCHSAESILLVLSKNPWPYTIKEISDLTNLHRNTIRESLKKLKENRIINSLGVKNPSDKTKKKYGIDQYYYESISDHYRALAKSLDRLPSETSQKVEIASNLGFHLVKDRLDEIFENLQKMENLTESRFTHVNLEHALLHLKMAYPFSDLFLDEDNQLILDTKFSLKTDKSDDGHSNSLSLKLNPCLCTGKQETYLACAMVSGALKAITKSAIGIESDIKWESTGTDEDGQYCTYNIRTHEMKSKPNDVEKDDPVLGLSQHRYIVI